MKSKKIQLLIIVLIISFQWTNAQKVTVVDNLPDDFTPINIEHFDTPNDNEYFFFAYMRAWNLYPDLIPYLVISDSYGTPIYYKKFNLDVMDLKIQPNGVLSYYESDKNAHVLMDSNYRVTDQISYIGQLMDFHDFHILDNGNYLLLGLEPRLVDMDTVVPGGSQSVTVVATHIQIQDTASNILFEWSGWDHFEITDTYADLLNQSYIDFTHTNAIEMDSDSTLLMSNRNMNEITKINMNTGDIIWRLGGKNNQFTYTSHDTLGFAGQHDIRRLSNGLYQMFDNGWNHEPPFSCALQLDLDEENMIADVVLRLRSQPDDIMGWIMGNAQYHDDGRMLVGWGDGDPNITEFDANGNKITEFSYEGTSYRAYKFPWQTTAFSFDKDNLDYGEAQPGALSGRKLNITNNLNHEIEINNIASRTGLFIPTDEFPLIVPVGEIRELNIGFSADSVGIYHDVLTICNDIENDTLTQRIAKQIEVRGEIADDAAISETESNWVKVYPNPVASEINITKLKHGQTTFEIQTLEGKLIKTIRSQSISTKINVSNLPYGIYILKATFEDDTVSYHKIVKQ